MTKKQIFSIRKYKIGVCSALIGATLLGVVGPTVGATDTNTMKSVSATVTATNHDVKELSSNQIAQIMKGIPELGKLNCGDTVHFAFEKDGKVVVTNEVPKKGGGITTTIQEPTKEVVEYSTKALPNTGVGETSFNQAILIGFIVVGTTAFVIYKRKESAKALVLLLAIGGIGYATNVNATGSMFNTSYSIEKSSMTTPSVEGYKYIGYWIEPGNCDIPNDYPTVELPSIEFKVPNNYPKVELPEGEVPTTPNTTTPKEDGNTTEKRGNVIVKYVADESGDEIKELLKLKENETDKTPYKAERIPIIDAGDYVYKLVEEKLPNNEDGAVAEGKTIEVIYRYVKEQKKGNVIIEFINDKTGEKIINDYKLLIDAPAGTDYSSVGRIRSLKGLVLLDSDDKLPQNEKGLVIGNETIKITYRYAVSDIIQIPPSEQPPAPWNTTTDLNKQTFAITVNYVSSKTGKVIKTLTEIKKGNEEYDFSHLNTSTFTDETTGKTYNITNTTGDDFTGIVDSRKTITIELEDEVVYGWQKVIFKDYETGEVISEDEFKKEKLKPVGTDYDDSIILEYFGENGDRRFTFNEIKYYVKEYEGNISGKIVEGENILIFFMQRVLEFEPLPS